MTTVVKCDTRSIVLPSFHAHMSYVDDESKHADKTVDFLVPFLSLKPECVIASGRRSEALELVRLIPSSQKKSKDNAELCAELCDLIGVSGVLKDQECGGDSAAAAASPETRPSSSKVSNKHVGHLLK